MHALIRLARCFCVQMPRLLLMLVPLLLEMAASLQLTQVCCRLTAQIRQCCGVTAAMCSGNSLQVCHVQPCAALLGMVCSRSTAGACVSLQRSVLVLDLHACMH
jgi:hypothetical protein